MRATKSTPKQTHIQSTPNLPPARKVIHEQPSSNNKDSQQQLLIQHRKQIQSTLNQLHRLQSQIYELNVPENPHSTSPVKKEIKQLSYLYENMAKPKTKNALNVKSTDIQLGLRIINKQWTPDTQLQPQIGSEQQTKKIAYLNQIDLLGKTKTNMLGNNTISNKGSNFRATIKTNSTQNLIRASNRDLGDRHYNIPKQKLQQKFQKITHCPLSLSFIGKSQKNQNISTKQLYQFINFTQCDNFDPIRKAYQMFLNPEGEFDLKIYNQINQILGLPKIKNINTFVAAIYQSQELAQSKNQSYVNSLSNTSRQVQSKPERHEMPLIGKNSNSMTAKISFEQFKQILDLQL